MNEKELRIGNLVQFQMHVDKIEHGNVDGIMFNQYTNEYDIYINEPYDGITFPVSFFKPITLTNEWLLKLGFEQDQPPHSRFNFKLRDGYYLFFEKSKNGYILEDIDGDLLTEVKYVHSLQNLIFALTDKELVIDNQFSDRNSGFVNQ